MVCKAGIAEFTDAAVNDPAVRQVRERTTAVADASIGEDQAHVDVELDGGRVVSRFVAQSLGNVNRPMTDRQLDGKFRDQAVLALPAPQVESLIARCWRIDTIEDVGELVKAAVPAPRQTPAVKA